MSDAQWLCQLLEAGLLRANQVPPKPIRALRNLTRYRLNPNYAVVVARTPGRVLTRIVHGAVAAPVVGAAGLSA